MGRSPEYRFGAGAPTQVPSLRALALASPEKARHKRGMSGHGHEHGSAHPHAGHDDHHETSSDDFPADEPHSPAWLPLLGGALFLAGIFAFVALGPGGKTADELANEAAAANPNA